MAQRLAVLRVLLEADADGEGYAFAHRKLANLALFQLRHHALIGKGAEMFGHFHHAAGEGKGGGGGIKPRILEARRQRLEGPAVERDMGLG